MPNVIWDTVDQGSPRVVWDEPPQLAGGSGPMSFGALKALWVKAGGRPEDATIMAHVAMAESGGNPQSNRSGKTNYQERGHTFYPQGLWQISTVHGLPNMFDAMANAKAAVLLHRAQGMAPWEASRVQKGGGGWGQYLGHGETPGGVSPAHMGGGDPGTVVWDTPTPGKVIWDTPPPARAQPQATPSAQPQAQAPADQRQVQWDQEVKTPYHSPWWEWILAPPAAAFGEFGKLLEPTDTKTMSRQQADLIINYEYFRRNHWEDLFTVLNSGSRATGAYLQWLQTPAGQRRTSLLKAVGDAVFHPGNWDPQGGTHSDAATAEQERFLGMPSDVAVKAFMDKHLPKEWAPYGTAISEGLLKDVAQTVLDPTTYLPLGDVVTVGARGVRGIMDLAHIGAMATKIAAATNIFGRAAKAAGVGKLFAHLEPIAGAYSDIAKLMGKGMQELHESLSGRGELDKFLTPAGKAAFLAQERGIRVGESKLEELDAKRNFGNIAVARSRARKYGASDQTLSTLEAMKPSERREAIDKLRKDGVKEALRNETKQTLLSDPGRMLKDTPEWKNWPPDPKSYVFSPESLRLIRNTIRMKMFVNPLPHFAKNVPMLTALYSGLSSVPRGLYFALGGKMPQEVERALGGAMEHYTMGANTSLYDYLPLIGPITRKEVEIMQNFGTKLERGMRAAALEYTYNKMGWPPAKAYHLWTADEKIKDFDAQQMVALRIGDPENVPKLLRTFTAMGGPWVAFRFGVVPYNFLKSIAEDPSRALSIMRPFYDIQQSRSKTGQLENVATIGGPPEDFSKYALDIVGMVPFLRDPTEYIKTQASLGPLGGGGEDYADEGLLTRAQHILWGLPPGGTEAEGLYDAVWHHSMPGPYKGGRTTYQSMTYADAIMVEILSAWGGYMARQQSQSAWNYLVNKIRKGQP